MRDLLILGAGVHAAEMVEIVERVNIREPTWNLLGFVAAKEERLGGTLNGAPVLGAKEIIDQHPDACLVPDNEWPRGEPVPRERLVSLVDPSAFVSRTASIGRGSFAKASSLIPSQAAPPHTPTAARAPMMPCSTAMSRNIE